MRHLLLLLALLAYTQLPAQNYPTGEVFDAAVYNSLPLKAPVSTRSILPPRVDLSPYAPTAGDQGDLGTCASWSSAYHFRTIIEAKQRGLTDQAAIDAIAYSPTWVNELLRDSTDLDCNGGVMTARSMLVFKEFGVPSYKSLPFQCYTGSATERLSNLDPLVGEAAKAKIRDFQILFLAKEGVDPQDKIRAIKKVLAEGYPVLVSHTLYQSFFPGKDVWQVVPGEETTPEKHGSHAMVIVGYDDDKYGGAFRYMNSWGPEWGDEGFIWVPYATTGELCYGAYQAYPFEKVAPKPNPVPAPPTPSPAPAPPTPAPAPSPTPTPEPTPVAAKTPSGSLEFVLRDGSPMPVRRVSTRGLFTEDDVAEERPAYRMARSYPSGTRFRFYLNTANEGYVYAFASDLTGEVTKIFPYDDQVSPLVGANSTIAFPADTKVIRMDNQPGNDYLLVLYSQQALDAAEVLRRMQAAGGNLGEKLRSALGAALIDPGQVRYEAGRVGFAAAADAAGLVVPVLVEIGHD